jgi:hypothetical protein
MRSIFCVRWIGLCVVCMLMNCALAAAAWPPADAIFDEAKVRDYVLPDPLVMQDGSKVETPEDWTARRRPEILRLFEEHVYGRSPKAPDHIVFEVTETDAKALGGKATRKQVTIYVTGDRAGPSIDLLLFIPNAATKPAPVFVGLNFFGNHSINADPAIKLSERWMRSKRATGVVDGRSTEASRGSRASRWPVETIVERGYALGTVYYGDIELDRHDGWKTGIRTAFDTEDKTTGYGPDRLGQVGVWAWGLSRVMDYLQQDADVDSKRVAVMGHSRLGKTSLWTGARDKRFAIVISSSSGHGGAVITRRRFGGAVHHCLPRWYRESYDRTYAKREDELPVDGHMLVALMAPRPVYAASATKDPWCDPRGTFLAAKHAGPVYRLFDRGGVGADEMPRPEHPIGDFVGYHLRTGEHDVTDFDWKCYLDFADRHYEK